MRNVLLAAAVGGLVGFLPVTASAQQVLSGGDYVKAHNDLRAKHCVPPLKRSARLEEEARKWALLQAQRDEMEHATDLNGIGENLFSAAQSSGSYNDGVVHQRAAQDWYDEIKDYKFDSPRPHADTNGVVGHFTQLVWRASTEVGCANVAYTKDGMNKVVSVCRYAPGGNDVSNDGALYKVNVPKACK